MMKRSFLSLVSMAFIAAMTLTSCEEIMSAIDNPVDSYLEVDGPELYVAEGSSIDVACATISDGEVTFTVADAKVAKVEKAEPHMAKVTGLKVGETDVIVKLAATEYYKAAEAKVKIIVKPTYSLKDAVVDGAKLLIGYKFNGEDCLFAYEFDASHKVFNQLAEDSDVPAALDDYTVTITYDEQMGKIAHKVTYNGNDATMIVVPFELNLYTAGSFDRIFRVPVVMTSLKVHGYELLPFTPESVTPIQSLQAVQLGDMSTGTKGSFAVLGVTPQNATNQVIKYSSSNTAVMTIDANGNFEAVGAGEATLKAEATDGSGKFVEHMVTVTEGSPYLKWDEGQKELVETAIPTTATKVENKTTDVTWSAGTYVVEGEVEINGTITLTGDVKLIIKDDAKLTAKQISGNSKNLSIYGQANKSGQLVVNCSSASAILSITTLEVHSCKVKATSSYGLGGGFNGIGTFNVYGGSVDAEGTNTGEGGYGILVASGGTMNIYGGDVTAVGKGGDSTYSYGIRTYYGGSASVIVYGGKLRAECAGRKAFYVPRVTLTKDAGYTSGKIQTSSDGSSWADYTGATTPETKYVRVGY